MNSLFKGFAHSVLTGLVMWLPLAHADWLNLTVGGVITIGANWLLSNYVPTTTGASSKQG